MTTELLPASAESIAKAAEIIRNGGVVGFPTETVYGLGANALDARAVKRIFEAKGRPGDNPLIVHIASLDQIGRLIDGPMPDMAVKLARAFWPGPLTMIMKKSILVPDAVSADLPTVGIRMPAHPAARALIEASGVPIAAPSANRSGGPSPTTARHVFQDMDGRVPLILDGSACDVGLESTVLNVTACPPRVLRPGAVTPEMIAKVCGEVEIDRRVLSPLADGDKPSSPGMKYQHYAPNGELSIVLGGEGLVAKRINAMYDAAASAGKRARILALGPHLPMYGARCVHVLGQDERQAAQNLFAALRDMDALGAEVILAEGFQARGVGLALMNRLARAAAFRLIDVGDGT